MKNKNLAKYSLYTDLAIERYTKKNKDIQIDKETMNDITITTNTLNSQKNRYVTIEFFDITDSAVRKKITKVFIKQLKKILKVHQINNSDSCLIIGLGNSKSTPDSLGPNVANEIIVTSHLFKITEFKVESGYREVSSISPNVMALTGIETYDLVESIVKKTNPKFIITVDALIAKSLSRINKVIQISDTGVLPGSGIGCYQKEISQQSLGIPVISIGVPTIVDVKTIISDSLDFYSKSKLKNKKALKQELKSTLNEISASLEYNLIVTPKEIDFVIKNLSEILINGINKTLHEIK